MTATTVAADRSTSEEMAADRAIRAEALARIAVTYRVPARLGAPVEIGGVWGQVIGVDAPSERVWVHLRGQLNAQLFHPRHRVIWLEENGPATAVPQFPLRPAPLYAWSMDEGQWSGV